MPFNDKLETFKYSKTFERQTFGSRWRTELRLTIVLDPFSWKLARLRQ